ncbi:MAG: hypothetical protein KDB27_33325, partial [Planctomycetales bacterium]|nr:hypothetical protein [Planctomycetales bacterium]
MGAIDTALSALRANQMAMEIVGNNIANTNTPNFHRQEARFETNNSVNLSGFQVGQGVKIAYIHRSYDFATEEAILLNIADLNAIQTQLSTA